MLDCLCLVQHLQPRCPDSSLNKQEKRCTAQAQSLQGHISVFQLLERSLALVPVGVPFEELLPKLEGSPRPLLETGTPPPFARAHPQSVQRNVLRCAPSRHSAPRSAVEPLFREETLALSTCFLHTRWELACRRSARQSVTGFCFETPSQALLPTTLSSAAREHREFDPREIRCSAKNAVDPCPVRKP